MFLRSRCAPSSKPCSRRRLGGRNPGAVSAVVEGLESRLLLSSIVLAAPGRTDADHDCACQHALGGGADVVTGDPNDWPMFNHDAMGTRYNWAEHQLRADNIAGLEVKWTFVTDGAVAGTPVVVNDIVYATDSSGAVYAVNRDGSLRWKTTIEVPTLLGVKFATSPLVTNRTVIVGDLAGRIHGLDIDTGDVKWTTNPNPHPFAAIFGNGTMVGKYVAYGTSSFELLVPALDPSYTNFTFRGSVVLLDPSDGSIVWQTFTIADDEHAAGASGATVWGAGTSDAGGFNVTVTTPCRRSCSPTAPSTWWTISPPRSAAGSSALVPCPSSTPRTKPAIRFSRRCPRTRF